MTSSVQVVMLYVFVIKNKLRFFCSCHTNLSVYPVCRWVLCVFHRQLYNSLSVQKAGAGAHRKATHFLQTWDKKVHPEHSTQVIYINLSHTNKEIILFVKKMLQESNMGSKCMPKKGTK